MKALDYLYRMKQANDEMGMTAINLNEAIQELEALEIKLKQGQENYRKLWDMYSELKKQNKELEEEMRNLTTELILNMLKENK